MKSGMNSGFRRAMPQDMEHVSESGGERGIRTPARVTPTNGLANHPLQPLGYLSAKAETSLNCFLFWRRGWDSNPRPITETPVFKTGSINHSDISPRRLVYYSKRGGKVSSETGARKAAHTSF